MCIILSDVDTQADLQIYLDLASIENPLLESSSGFCSSDSFHEAKEKALKVHIKSEIVPANLSGRK